MAWVKLTRSELNKLESNTIDKLLLRIGKDTEGKKAAKIERLLAYNNAFYGFGPVLPNLALLPEQHAILGNQVPNVPIVVEAPEPGANPDLVVPEANPDLVPEANPVLVVPGANADLVAQDANLNQVVPYANLNLEVPQPNLEANPNPNLVVPQDDLVLDEMDDQSRHLIIAPRSHLSTGFVFMTLLLLCIGFAVFLKYGEAKDLYFGILDIKKKIFNYVFNSDDKDKEL